MTGLTTQIPSVHQAMDMAIKICLETHKKAPTEFQLGPEEYQYFMRESDSKKSEYRGIPVRKALAYGLNFTPPMPRTF